MTDRIKGLTVTIQPNMREDDAEAIISAIQMVKGVIDVKTHVADCDHHMAVSTARLAMEKDILDLIGKWNNT